MDVMKNGPESTLSPGRVVALAAGLSVGAGVGYMVYRHLSSSRSSCSSSIPAAPQLADCEESMLTLPLDIYKNISLHQATFLDTTRENTGAHVQVTSATGELVCLRLRGSPEQILLAKCVLTNLATDCERATEVLDVPQTAFGRIIGRGGESKKLITLTTGATLFFSPERRHDPDAMGKVTITGTHREVQQAKEIILEQVRDDATVRKKICQSSALRQKRGPHDLFAPKCEAVARPGPTISKDNNNGPSSLSLCLLSAKPGGKEEEELEDLASPDSLSEVSKFEIPSPDLSFQPDEHLEVYVSAYENPSHFWIQILGVRSLQLDKLTTEMSRLYSTGTSTEYVVESVIVGDIVAAEFRQQGKWNRARVLSLLGSNLVDLYYVDFGDSHELPKEALRSMRSDFLSLPFQAIECSLAGVQPTGEAWTEEALDDFDKITYCADWRPLRAKLCSYSHSDVCTWPSIKLYDNSQGMALDLGEELIRMGHATSCQEAGLGGGDSDTDNNLGSLQRMLDDVIGASSELSLSCISLSEVASISGSVDDAIDDELLS